MIFKIFCYSIVFYIFTFSKLKFKVSCMNNSPRVNLRSQQVLLNFYFLNFHDP